jgi:hypothetical protein
MGTELESELDHLNSEAEEAEMEWEVDHLSEDEPINEGVFRLEKHRFPTSYLTPFI